MKKTLLFIIGILLLGAGLRAQTAEELDTSRDRSKYANDSFIDGETYTVTTPYETVTVAPVKGKKVKNVILMIGDGMGVEQVSAGWVLNGGHLNMDNMPVSGYARTWTVDKLVTDSGAAGTSIACGVKTKYAHLGLDADGNPVESVLRDAQSKGMKTGLAVTCRLNDCTPVDFFAHAVNRKDEPALAAAYVDSGIDWISGGGSQFWRGREDGRDLVQEMIDKGYTYVDDPKQVLSIEKGPVVGLFAPLEMEPALDRGPVLEDCATKAIELLDNKKGFFLMIEGSSIDDWCHRHKIGYAMEELFDFDRTIGKVLKWAEQDGETLVVVLADHATGGLTLIKGSIEERTVNVHFSTKGHNGIMVPVFAYGPRSEDFMGVYENAAVGQKIRNIILKKK